ncbi:MAG: RNase P modulator RnpM [Dehalococcoidia bacterium]
MQATGPKPRHVPQRTCIGCREEQGKRTFVRIVRTPDGRVIVDPTGRANGRGAYLHPLRACWVKALKGATIQNALKISPAKTDVEALRAFADVLPVQEAEGGP